ncbi:MAG: tandem-95 repeat protein, partial [Alteromonadales bacterium]|nr:tandem-95 repeat protein [Alteromonadales bacterium]
MTDNINNSKNLSNELLQDSDSVAKSDDIIVPVAIDEQVLSEIEAIQAAIEEEGDTPIEDIETAAGEAADGGSSSAVDFSRDGAETLVSSDFKTAGFDFNSASNNITDTNTQSITANNEGESANVGPSLTANDAEMDEDGEPVTVTFTATDSDGSIASTTATVDPEHGSVVINDDGTYTFTPAKDFNGEATITLVTTDNDGATATFDSTVSVTPVNDIPVLVDENGAPLGDNVSVTTEEDTPVTGTLNATDADNDALTFTSATQPTNGSAVVAENGEWTYTPNNDYNGNDSFTVVVSDGKGGTDTITVNVGITPVNDIPVLVDENGTPLGDNVSVTTEEDTPVTGTLTATDADNDALTFTSATQPTNGSVVVAGNGEWTYTPNNDYNGNDSFTVVVSDGKGGTDTIIVNVGVTPVNDPAIISEGSGSVVEDVQPTIDGRLTATDADNAGLVFVAETIVGKYGDLTQQENGNWSYTLNDNADVLTEGQIASDTITVNLSDNSSTTVKIDITGTDVLVPDDTVTVKLVAVDADVIEGETATYTVQLTDVTGAPVVATQ